MKWLEVAGTSDVHFLYKRGVASFYVDRPHLPLYVVAKPGFILFIL